MGGELKNYHYDVVLKSRQSGFGHIVSESMKRKCETSNLEFESVAKMDCRMLHIVLQLTSLSSGNLLPSQCSLSETESKRTASRYDQSIVQCTDLDIGCYITRYDFCNYLNFLC